MSLGHRPPISSLFARGTLLVSLLPALVGINAVLRPSSALEMLGFRSSFAGLSTSSPSPTDEQDRLALALTQMYGARQLSLGLTTIAAFSVSDDPVVLGAIMLAGIPIAVIDGFVSKALTGKGQWGHWAAVPVSLVLGLGLFGWVV